MAYQSLYLLYRPTRFSEIKGQDHVVRALQTAVREHKVGHAYLLHGPRGSGKTSTARVLAKALNCTDIGDDGEPCCVCESCVSIQKGRSFDLQELDAASNNKVDDMRALLERVNLSSPGQAKVYLLDEVHMLTAGAENALLKTLEEPPGHVTWVLATTEPHKVAQTIRSRCQVFELGLVGADLMAEHVRYVVSDAGLEVDDDAVDYVVSVGDGSVRDTLSALDRVAAGGGTVELDSSTDDILDAIADRDPVRALSAVGEAVGRGRDPRTVGEAVLAGLRDAFLTAMGDPPPRLSEHEQSRAAAMAEKMAPPAMTRGLETLGRALVDMRQAPDPRVDIEVALVRLCQADQQRSLESLLDRVQRLEERLGPTHGGSPPTAEAPPPPASEAPRSPTPAPPRPGAPAPADPQPRGRSRPGGPARSAREMLGPRPTAPKVGAETAHAGPSPDAPSRAVPPPVPAQDPALLRPQTATEVVELAGRHLGFSRQSVIERANELLPPREGRRDPDELLVLWHDLVARWEAERSSQRQDSPESPAEAMPGPDAGSGASSEPAAGDDAASASDGSPGASSEPRVESGPAASLEPRVESGSATSSRSRAESGLAASSESRVESGLAASSESRAESGLADDYGDDESIDVDSLREAPTHAADIEARIMQMFPGARLEDLSDSDESGAS